MAIYLVTWEIDIDAETPLEAARIALEIQRDKDSTATVFDVTNHHDSDDRTCVDLIADPDDYVDECPVCGGTHG